MENNPLQTFFYKLKISLVQVLSVIKNTLKKYEKLFQLLYYCCSNFCNTASGKLSSIYAVEVDCIITYSISLIAAITFPAKCQHTLHEDIRRTTKQYFLWWFAILRGHIFITVKFAGITDLHYSIGFHKMGWERSLIF